MKNNIKLNSLGYVVACTVICVVILLADILMSVLLTIPFSLYTGDWGYWIGLLKVIVVLQAVLSFALYLNTKRKGK